MFARTNKRLFILALILAIACAAVVYVYLKQLEKASIATPQETVVVVKSSVEARERLTSDMLAEVKIAADAIHPQAIRSIKEAVGTLAKSNLVEGEQLLSSRLEPGSSDSQLAYTIPEGMRAATVGVDERIGVAMLLQPGDKVDVVAAFTDEADKQSVKLVLQDIEVLALGQRTFERNQPDKPDAVSTVTLAVSPEQAETLIWAEEFGHIRLLLRPVGYSDTHSTVGVTVETIKQR